MDFFKTMLLSYHRQLSCLLREHLNNRRFEFLEHRYISIIGDTVSQILIIIYIDISGSKHKAEVRTKKKIDYGRKNN